MRDKDIELMVEAIADFNGLTNPNITEFELRRGYKEWEKITKLYDDVTELILEDQRQRDLAKKQHKAHHSYRTNQ